MRSSPVSAQEHGFVLITFGVIAVTITATVGLSIDTGIAYLVKSKLSAAVDAGALAGARSLSRGESEEMQADRAQQVAQRYVRLNFPAGFLGARSLNVTTPDVQSGNNQRSVSVAASVVAPAYFMSVVGMGTVGVNARARAIRRDVNVMLVMDRSGSLARSNSCDGVKEAAISFVNKFAETRDNVGLVTFASTSILNYPMGNRFKGSGGSLAVETIVNQVQCVGATSTAEALSLGYWHLADLGETGALNVLVLFTDGEPTGVTANVFRAAGSTCANAQMKGVATVGFNGAMQPAATFGLLAPTTMWPIADGDQTPAPGTNGCIFLNGGNPNYADTRDFSHISALDIWGNDMRSQYRTNYRTVNIDGESQIQYADPEGKIAISMNAADSAASRIRNGDPVTDGVRAAKQLSNVAIFAIGLGNTPGPASEDFMLRVANDPRGASFNGAQRAGLYVYAPTEADVRSAFDRVASEILRLAE